jgi:hypothetical protein
MSPCCVGLSCQQGHFVAISQRIIVKPFAQNAEEYGVERGRVLRLRLPFDLPMPRQRQVKGAAERSEEMKRGNAVAVVFLLIFAAGCGQSKQVRVTYKSDPPGGILHELNGEVRGLCPKTLWYDLDEETIKNGYIDVKGLIVRWPGGPPERRSNDLIRIKVDGTDRQVTFRQPGMATNATHTERLSYRRY